MLEPKIYQRKTGSEHHGLVEYRLYFAGVYSGSLRDGIIQFKFHRQRNLGPHFGEYIHKNLPKDYDLNDYDYLLPVPSKPSSTSERGYDTVRLIGESLSELCGLPVASGILEALERLRQTRVPENQRRLNIKGAFRLIDSSRVVGKGFLVLDDVSKTGSTLDEVMRTLSMAAPRQLDAVVLAKAGKWT